MLHSLSQGLPDALFGKTLREVYITVLTDSGATDWNQFLRLMGLCSAHELRSRIESCVNTLKETIDDSAAAVLSFNNPLVCFLEELNRLEAEDADDMAAAKSRNLFVPQQGRKMDKFELKAVIVFITLLLTTYK